DLAGGYSSPRFAAETTVDANGDHPSGNFRCPALSAEKSRIERQELRAWQSRESRGKHGEPRDGLHISTLQLNQFKASCCVLVSLLAGNRIRHGSSSNQTEVQRTRRRPSPPFMEMAPDLAAVPRH